MNATLPFVAAYTKPAGSQQVKATGLTVTCSVLQIALSNDSVTVVAGAQAATEIIGISGSTTYTTGTYLYAYSGALDFTKYYYQAYFNSSDSTTQQADIAAAWFDFPASIAKDSAGNVTLGSAGLDNVTVETGLNARQALSIIGAACAGTDTISSTSATFAGAGVSVPRISAALAGNNRSSVTLTPPA